MTSPLPAPARYFPFEKGIYEIAPGLRTFGTSFGNGALDSQVFQFDDRFEEFRASKLACRAEGITRYYLERDHSPEVAAGVARWIAERLPEESPRLFAIERNPDGSCALACRLTRETLRFDRQMRLQGESPYLSALDALAMQVPEDLSVLTLEPASGRNWLSAIHVCSPSSWRPEEKVGLDFTGIHSPVPASEALLKASRGIVAAMVNKGPYVRFNWGITTYSRPNHHPDLPPGPSLAETLAREDAPVFLWVERQVTWGIPEVQASLFTIRISFQDLREVRRDPVRLEQLLSTLRSMSPEVREYKGLGEDFDRLVGWLGRRQAARE